MKRSIVRFLIIFFLIIFLGSVGYIVINLIEYATERKVYEKARESFVTAVPIENTDLVESDVIPEGDSSGEGLAHYMIEQDGTKEGSYTGVCPISVDFEALQQINSDIVGWIICEDSVINYPILRNDDNEYYLHRSYDKKSATSGSIFAERMNDGSFTEPNTILYGHHMKDGSMFASLSKWSNQEYYEAHPYMWIITPEKAYKLHLISGFYTDALSSTYSVYNSHGDNFTAYIESAVKKSNFKSEITASPDANYVILSTCEYRFENARYVLYGMLE